MHPSLIALRNPSTVLLLTVLTVLLGISSYRTLPREAAPDIQIPILVVSIPYPGASPEDVERLVTREAEEKLQNVDNLKKLSSVSSEGISIITLQFQLGFDILDARNKARERLDEAKPLFPEDVEEPVISEINLSEEPILRIVLSGPIGLEALRTLAEELEEDIEAFPETLEVDLFGGLKREIQVYVDPERLRYHQTSLNRVADVVASENSSLPGGSLEIGPQRYSIRVPSEYQDPQEINLVIVSAVKDASIYVRDLARVEFGFQEQKSRSRLDGQESVSLAVSKRSGANLFLLRDKIEGVLENHRLQNQQVRFSVLADTSIFVRQFVKDLENNVITGFTLVFLVLLVVMGARNALLVASAIPLSFLMALIVMRIAGFTLNFVVLFSLILSLGLLVDNAIVVVENIFRHLQSGKSHIDAARIGVQEVAMPVFTSTLTTLAAFGPLIFMPGIIGEFMSYLPRTLIFTLSASLVVGLIINPVMCSRFMKRPRQIFKNEDELANLHQSPMLLRYRGMLEFCLQRRKRVLLGAVATFFGVIFLYGTLVFSRKGVEFFPKTEPESATIIVTAAPGASLDVSDGLMQEVEHMVNSHQDSLVAYLTNVGGGARGSSGSHISQLTMEFPGWKKWLLRPSKVLENLRTRIKEVAGADVNIQQEAAGPPTGKPVNIELSGNNLREMLETSDAIKRRIVDVPGLVDLDDDFERIRPEVQVQLDREKIARAGFSSQEVGRLIRTAFNGRTVSTMRRGKEEFDIVVRLDERFRNDVQNISDLYLFTKAGEQIPLSELAEITTAPALGSIRHVELDRVITISGDAQGYPGPVVLREVRNRLDNFPLPANFNLRYTGENEDREEAQGFLGESFLVVLFLIFIILVTQFNSFYIPLIILSSVMLSLIGVFLGLIIHNRPFSIMMGGIGVISLAGIVVNNAIVLLDFITQLQRKGYHIKEAVLLSGMARLRPVLLTAITTVLGLLPVAMRAEVSLFSWPFITFGSESSTFWVPMSLAVIYGLSAATVLTLFFVPTLYITMAESTWSLRSLRRGLNPLVLIGWLMQLADADYRRQLFSQVGQLLRRLVEFIIQLPSWIKSLPQRAKPYLMSALHQCQKINTQARKKETWLALWQQLRLLLQQLFDWLRQKLQKGLQKSTAAYQKSSHKPQRKSQRKSQRKPQQQDKD